MLDLKNKVVLITGLGQSQPSSSSETEPDKIGIGAAIAILLARQGALIFGGNRSVASALQTQKTIESFGGTCTIYPTDVTSSTSVQSLIQACLAKHNNRIDILINSVGGSEKGCPVTMSEEIWDRQMEVNLKSVFLLTKGVLPILERQWQHGGGGGCVVCVGSIAGKRYIGKEQVAYSSAKAAVRQFVKTTAVVYARRGVRLNCVVPGLMDTPYTKGLVGRYAIVNDERSGGDGDGLDEGEGEGKAEKDGEVEEEVRRKKKKAEDEYMKMRNDQVPMGRMGDAWDVAHAALFLVSDEARYITGQEIVVDGGITCSTGRV